MKRACLFAVAGLACLAASVHALDASGAKQVIEKFLAGQKTDRGAGDAFAHAVSDINGDGNPDIVLVWNVVGATSAWPHLTVFLDAGRNYRVLTAELEGQLEKLSVKGTDIFIDTLMPGPKDPRCCPTLKQQVHIRWQGGKLVQFR